jgi:hypothetical protein
MLTELQMKKLQHNLKKTRQAIRVDLNMGKRATGEVTVTQE